MRAQDNTEGVARPIVVCLFLWLARTFRWKYDVNVSHAGLGGSRPVLEWVGWIGNVLSATRHLLLADRRPGISSWCAVSASCSSFDLLLERLEESLFLGGTARAALLRTLCAPKHAEQSLRGPLSAPGPKYVIPPSSFVSWPPRRASPVRPAATGWQCVSLFHGRTLRVWNRSATSRDWSRRMQLSTGDDDGQC